VLDTSGAITYWNRGAEKLYGYPRGEAVAMNTLDMVPKKYRAVMCEILRRISNGEAAGSFEIQRKTRDGRVLDVGLTITRLRDSAGKVRTLAFTERDITRQKLREKQLLAANVNLEKKIRQRTAELARRTEEFRTLANNVPALFAYIDSDQRYRFVNHRHAQVWGRPTTDIIGRTVEELLGSQQFEKIRANVKAALAGEYITYEQSFEFGDRSLVMSINYVPDRDSQGQVRGLYALIVDITEQKRIQQSLVRQQQRLSAIVNTLADGLVTLDSGGIIEAFNPAAEHMFGYPTEAVTGKPFTLLFAEPVTATQPQILDRFLTREDRPIYHNITGQHRDGTDFPLEISIRQIDHRDSYVCLMRDCSERKQLEREIIETSTLEQEYFGREIHDGIGQELTAVTMLAVSLKSQLERAQYSAATVAMDQLIQHLQRTLGQAKALATGLSPIDIGPDGLTDALSALVERIEAASGIHCRFERSVSALDIDENTATHLYRIAQEAINNAVKHARARNIAVQLRREAGTIVLAVEDDGIGIPAKLPSKSKLGLHIMRYRARIIGGYLEIKRLAGGGTRIQCVLPGAHSNTVASA
jgi:PAS domain S-box-containing protein